MLLLAYNMIGAVIAREVARIKDGVSLILNTIELVDRQLLTRDWRVYFSIFSILLIDQIILLVLLQLEVNQRAHGCFKHLELPHKIINASFVIGCTLTIFVVDKDENVTA